ncbi:MAG: SpoIID/LytB domain-containing protein [Anaerolineae bacterium]|nr:SpoIID/LytB domain-containing protein [Anaerolineae bacterium]
MRRPGLWVANGHPGDTTLMYSWRPGSITCFYDYLGFNRVFEYKAANPAADIIVRFQHPRNWQQNPAYYARQLGEQVASKWGDLRRMDPYVYFANENNLHYENGNDNPGDQHLYTSPQFYKQYADWVRMTADIIKNIVPEMKLITPPFAFGHHEDGAPDDNGNPTEGWAGYDYLQETVKDYFDNILTFHAYWGNAAGSNKQWLYDPDLSTWFAFRWKRVLKLFEARYGIQAKMIIDEAGNFAAGDPDFTDQIMYHAEKCLNDARVIAITYFLWHDPTRSAGNLPNSWTQGARDLRDHVRRLQAMPDVPIIDEKKPPRKVQQGDSAIIRVLFPDGTVRAMTVGEYLRAVVPSEMAALWPMEALKAQAIASRTYAMYHIGSSRFKDKGADICATTRCQHYDENKIHERSDEAIRQTAGIVIRYNGKLIEALFSASCGGHTKNSEDYFTAALPYLRGVPCPNKRPASGHGVGMCQRGAVTLAEQGRTFDQILRHYYTGVTLGLPSDNLTSNILGTVIDHLGRPVKQVPVILTGAGQRVEVVTDDDGTFRLSNVPAGSYTIELPDYDLRRENISPTAGQDLKVTIEVPAPPAPEIIVEIERIPGLPIVLGNWGQPNKPIRINAPSGNVYQVMTGTKPEFGPGGFEFYAIEKGTYVLEIEGNRFEVPTDGRTIRLTFRKSDGTPPSQPAGVIEGILRDHTNRVVPNRGINLNSDRTKQSTKTDENGYFAFEKLSMGRYVVTVADSEIQKEAYITGSNRVALALKFAEPPGGDEWQITLERRAGLPLLVGDIGLPNRPIVIIDPRRQRQQVTSGSKPEWGLGGFEVYATEIGNYVIEFEGQRFVIPMNGQMTHVRFERIPGTAADKVRLISKIISRAEAQEILTEIREDVPAADMLFDVVNE